MPYARNRPALTAVLLLHALLAPTHAFVPGAGLRSVPGISEGPRGITPRSGEDGDARFLTRLRATAGVHLDVDPKTRALRAAVGRLSEPAAGTPQDAAAAFVSSVLDLTVGSAGRSPGHALVGAGVRSTRGGTHVTFRHELDGTPVFGEEVAVLLDDERRVVAVIGDYHERAVNRGRATLDAAAALATVRNRFAVVSERGEPDLRTTWLVRNGQYTVGFEVRVAAAEPLADIHALVDAADGTLVGADDELCYATGQGRVFPHSGLDPELVTVPLPELEGVSKLSGRFVSVRNDDVSGATSVGGLFAFEPSNTHFDEVMVYHNLTQVHAFFSGLGFHGRDRVNHATVHYGTAFDNAAYSPMTGKFIFGDGKKLNDLAQEDDIAFHEFTHSVVGSIASSMTGGEAGAINEAVSDYFAATLSGNPKMGAWAGRKLGLAWMRHLENSKHYPADLENEVHKDSEIYSAACWDVRRTLGATITDALVLKSFYHFGHRADFARGLAAMLAADQALHGGANAGVFRSAFAARGIAAGGREARREAAFRTLAGGRRD